MDINTLFTEAGMRQATSEWRENHIADAHQYAQIADIIQARLGQERIDGDRGALSAKRRAWKVSRKARALAKLARRQAATTEALHAAYVNEVLMLPQRREIAAQRRAVAADRRSDRRQQRAINAGAAVSKSLHKTATVLGGEQVSAQVTAPVQGPQEAFVDAEPFPFPQAAGAEGQHLGSISDFFTSEAHR